MKPFSFSSPYSRIGAFFAVALLAAASFVEFSSRPAKPVYVIDTYRVTKPRPQVWKLIEPTVMDFSEFAPDVSDIPNFREPARWLNEASGMEEKAPCFTVLIDPTVPGADADYRMDLFGDGKMTVSTEAFTDGLKEKMAEEFSAEAWARDPNCFDGSFVVSFTVTEEGRLGKDMLVHHLQGQSNHAGISVLDVLRSMDRFGHRWHDGTKGSGEVRIPVKFKLG